MCKLFSAKGYDLSDSQKSVFRDIFVSSPKVSACCHISLSNNALAISGRQVPGMDGGRERIEQWKPLTAWLIFIAQRNLSPPATQPLGQQASAGLTKYVLIKFKRKKEKKFRFFFVFFLALHINKEEYC